MSEDLLEKVSIFRSWVLVSSISDHSPIVLQFEQELVEANYSFKFNHTWLKDVSFYQMVRDFLLFVSIPEGLNEMERLVLKLKKLKVKVVEWIKRKVLQDKSMLSLTKNKII